jgi:hypothetical protein
MAVLNTTVEGLVTQRDNIAHELAQMFPVYRRHLIDSVRYRLAKHFNGGSEVLCKDVFDILLPVKDTISSSFPVLDAGAVDLILYGKLEGNEVVHGNKVITKEKELEAITSASLSMSMLRCFN